MAEHPDELTLLSFVEGERPDIGGHVDGCPVCADRVRKLEAGRAALREAPLLVLPEERRARIMAELPPRRERRGFLAPLRRLGTALPAAAALILVASIVAIATQLGGGGADQQGASGGGEARDVAAAPEAAGTADTDEKSTEQLFSSAPVRQVEGPPREVVRRLRAQGFEARVVAGAVAVDDASPAEVRLALRDRPAGAVAVYVR